MKVSNRKTYKERKLLSHSNFFKEGEDKRHKIFQETTRSKYFSDTTVFDHGRISDIPDIGKKMDIPKSTFNLKVSQYNSKRT